MTLLQSGIAKSLAEDYTIDQSLRFNAGDSPSLTWTPGSESNRRTFTLAFWTKICDPGVDDQKYIINTPITTAAGDPNERGFALRWGDSGNEINTLELNNDERYFAHSPGVYRDPSAWYHIVIAFDMTAASASDRMSWYINGEDITSTLESDKVADGTIPQNTDIALGYTHEIAIGKQLFAGTAYNFNGYLADFYYIDGQKLAASDFGESDEDTNQWKPIEYEGTYGTNGFYQKYAGTELADSFEDSSSSDHTITANGDVANTRAQQKIGDSSIYFPGDEDFLEAESMAVDYGSDFTAECWFYCTDASTSQGWPYVIEPRTPDVDCGVYSYIRADNLILNGESTAINENQWYHFAMVGDGANLRGYLDGVEFCDITNPGTGTPDAIVFGSRNADVGGAPEADSYFKGYMDEIRISDTCRYPDGTTFTTFGQDGGTIANPTPFTADANTKLLIHSDWDGGLGADSSGNYNTFTASGLVATDQMKDSPTNNFCTMNPLATEDMTLSEGNLRVDTTTNYRNSWGTMGVSSGKWYFEVLAKDYVTGGGSMFGLAEKTYITSNPSSSPLVGDCIGTDTYYGPKRGDDWADNGAYADIGTNIFADGDILQIAFDMDAGKFWAGKNNTWFDSGDPAAGTGNMDETFPTYTPLVPSMARGGSYDEDYIFNFGQDSSFAGEKTAQGNQDSGGIGDFYYEPPSGFKAICSSNLPDPEIADPTAHFNTALYTGNATTNAITGVGFQPDWLWVKNRTNTGDYPVMTDAVRGKTEILSSATTVSASWTDSTAVTSFDSDGFTLGNATTDWNRSGGSFAAWNWKGDGVSGGTLNEDGTIDSQVNVNTTAGFSIVSYTGDGSNGTVGHGLAQTPELFFLKRRDGTGWSFYGYSEPTGNTKSIYLNATTIDTDSTFWNDSSPTASVINVGTANGINQDTGTYLAYCFHSVEGYSKIGSYTGNGDADGPFVYTGFRGPAYLLIRRYDSGDNWRLGDDARNPYNVATKWIKANSSDSEADSGDRNFDFNSNGFKVRTTDGDSNASGGTYLFYAVAQTPFKTANAR